MNLKHAFFTLSLLTLIAVGASAKAEDLVETAANVGQFNTLVAALEAASLVEALRGEGPFTVFAPTDEAFSALPEGTLEELLLPENSERLSAILMYHVISGRVMSGDISGRQITVESLSGANLEIDAASGVNVQGANVISADIGADNGVIHVIDQVLLP